MAEPQRKGGLSGTLKGIRGAGDALRGSVNGGIAKGLGDEVELEKARKVRQDGMNNYRGSGIESSVNRLQEKAGARQSGRGGGVLRENIPSAARPIGAVELE